MPYLTVSAIIPTYNRGHLVGRALVSALHDLGPQDEVLVIDDGSTDNTEQVVQQLRDERVRYIRQTHSGAGAARNRGVQEATGDLIAFLDSDDEWLPGKTDIQRRYMAARPDVLFCFTDLARDFRGRRRALSRHYWHTDTRGWEEIMGHPTQYSTVAELPTGITDFGVYTGNIYRGEMHTNYLSTICIMIRRRDAGEAIHFAEGIPTFEDWECFGRLTRKGLGAYLDYVGALQVKHPGPRVTDANWLARAESRLTVLRNVWGADREFLDKYGGEYHALVREQRLAKVYGLLSLGRTREARKEMHSLKGAPISYHVLSRLPAGFVLSIVFIRRLVKPYVVQPPTDEGAVL